MCKLGRSVKKNIDAIAKQVEQPRFVCTDCGRVARDKDRLCEPKRLPGTKKAASGS
jgi:hypothetical protein